MTQTREKGKKNAGGLAAGPRSVLGSGGGIGPGRGGRMGEGREGLRAKNSGEVFFFFFFLFLFISKSFRNNLKII